MRRSLGITDAEHRHPEASARTRAQGADPFSGESWVAAGAAVAGRYRIDRLLGEGARGRAFLAHDAQGDRAGCSRSSGPRPSTARLNALLREARLMRKVQNSHVLQVFDVFDRSGEAVIVEEYADGGSLEALLERRGRPGLREAVDVLDRMLAGLEAAQAGGGGCTATNQRTSCCCAMAR